MAENQFQPVVDGQEISLPDYQGVGVVSGLADDRTLAEFLRLYSYDGTNVAKAIAPQGWTAIPGNGTTLPGAPTQAGATVRSTLSANGSIFVRPFRAFVGSRTTSAQPLLNYRDIRSGVFVGTTDVALTVALPPNSSGSTQWVLVYASIAVDQPGGTATRRVKSASTGVVTAVAVSTILTNAVTVTVSALGTGGALPALPADGGNIYNIALAYVKLQNGFNASSTIAARDIRDAAPLIAMASPTSGATRSMPASGNNDQDGTYGATDSIWRWGTAAATRPKIWLPPSMVGCESRIIQIDAGMSVSGRYSHANASVVDSSMDWRNRFVIINWSLMPAAGNWATDPAAGGAAATPYAGVAGLGAQTQGIAIGNTMDVDAALVASSSTVWSTSTVGLYVLNADGILRFWLTGVPNVGVWLWLFASGQYPNF